MTNPKILVLDIETRPALSYHWRMFKQNISIDANVDPGGILMVGLQWADQRRVDVLTEWDLGEEEMLRQVHERIMEADAVVTKNGTSFDIPHLKTWFLKYKMDPLPALTHIDLEKVARYNFNFLSNKLDFIGQFLEEGKKVEHEGFKLWTKVMDGDENARRRMARYCAQDVRLTTRLYKRMKGWISDHPTMRAIGSEACPTCESTKTQKRGYRYTRHFKIARHQCLNPECRGWFSGKRTKVA